MHSRTTSVGSVPARNDFAGRRAGRRAAQLAGVAVDVHEDDARRARRTAGSARPASARIMNGVQIGSAACAPLRPSGWLSSRPDPDDGQQLRREADEPGVAQVVGRAGLAGGVEREAGGARAGAGAFVEHAAHHVGHEERRVRRARSASAAVGAIGDVLAAARRCARCARSGRIDAAVREDACRPWRSRTASPRRRRARSTDTRCGGVPTPSCCQSAATLS